MPLSPNHTHNPRTSISSEASNSAQYHGNHLTSDPSEAMEAANHAEPLLCNNSTSDPSAAMRDLQQQLEELKEAPQDHPKRRRSRRLQSKDEAPELAAVVAPRTPNKGKLSRRSRRAARTKEEVLMDSQVSDSQLVQVKRGHTLTWLWAETPDTRVGTHSSNSQYAFTSRVLSGPRLQHMKGRDCKATKTLPYHTYMLSIQISK